MKINIPRKYKQKQTCVFDTLMTVVGCLWCGHVKLGAFEIHVKTPVYPTFLLVLVIADYVARAQH